MSRTRVKKHVSSTSLVENGQATAGEPAAPGKVASEDEIRLLAYHKWVEAGMPPGDGVQFWLEAEEQFRQWNGTPAS